MSVSFCMLEEKDAGSEIVIKKEKTIYDFVGTLPNLGMTVEEMREKAIEEAMKEDE